MFMYYWSFSATKSVQEAFETKVALLPYSPKEVVRIRKATHINEIFCHIIQNLFDQKKMSFQIVVILNNCATE